MLQVVETAQGKYQTFLDQALHKNAQCSSRLVHTTSMPTDILKFGVQSKWSILGKHSLRKATSVTDAAKCENIKI